MKASLLIALSCLAGAACASSPESTTPRTAVRFDEHLQAGNRAPGHDIFIEDNVASVCDLPKASSFFAVGSNGIEEVDQTVVRRVAECMKEGALKNEKVVVVGYTDPRGSADFNAQLGLQRAEAVAVVLVAYGVPHERVFIKSYGESKAKDKRSEADWARDRKATLRVAEPQH